jgi:hypothetical protein
MILVQVSLTRIWTDSLYCHVSWVPWRIITGSGLDGWIYWRLLCTISLNYKQYSAIADLHTFQFTVAHALGFSGSTNRILATDLNTGSIASNHYLTYCHLLPTGHSTGTPLPILHSNLLVKVKATNRLVIYTRHGPRRKHSLLTVAWRGPHRKHFCCCAVGHMCVAGMFTEPLPSNALSKSGTVSIIVEEVQK